MGWTALMEVAKNGKVELGSFTLAECLLYNGAAVNVNQRTSGGLTALDQAIQASNNDIIKLLIENGAGVTVSMGNKAKWPRLEEGSQILDLFKEKKEIILGADFTEIRYMDEHPYDYPQTYIDVEVLRDRPTKVEMSFQWKDQGCSCFSQQFTATLCMIIDKLP